MMLIIDGSPYNNHKRSDQDDRIMWVYPEFSPDPVYYANALCPVLSEKVDGDLETLDIGALFTTKFHAIDTVFKYHDEDYQRTPWLKAYYSLNNWGNTQEYAPY
jgi:hypothetical protein